MAIYVSVENAISYHQSKRKEVQGSIPYGRNFIFCLILLHCLVSKLDKTVNFVFWRKKARFWRVIANAHAVMASLWQSNVRYHQGFPSLQSQNNWKPRKLITVGS